MAAKWPHLWRLALHSDRDILMRGEALMGDNCLHEALAATGAQGCLALNNTKQTIDVGAGACWSAGRRC